MGETTVFGIDDSGNANLLISQPATLSQAATLQSLSFYVTAAAGNLRLGVYGATGTNGHPGQKLAETAELTPVVGWNTANVTTPVSLAAGQYWLAYFPSSNDLHFRKSAPGSSSSAYYSLTYGPLPSTFSSSVTTGVDDWSFYATLNVTSSSPAAPTVATPASASPSPVSGKTTQLSVLGSGPQGESGIVYTWSTLGTPPGSVTFSPNGTNAAKSSTATFSASGTYSLRASLAYPGGPASTSDVSVSVSATPTSITVSPATASVATNASVTFTRTVADQFGSALSAQPSATWSVSGGGAINASGTFTAGATAGGPFTVTATSGALTGTAQVTVTSGSGGGTPVNNWSYPLVPSSNGRYLVDSTGTPFPLLIEAAWGSLIDLTYANFQGYVQDRISKGFDGFELMACGRHPRLARPPYDVAGNLPFTNRLDGSAWNGSLSYSNASTDAPDFTTPNEKYWSAVDQKMTYLNSSKMVAMLFPAYNGYAGGDEGWMQEMVANGASKMRSYGAWLANRYKSYPNVIWMLGGDLGTSPHAYTSAQQAVEEAMTNGLKSVATASKQYSNEWDNSSSGNSIQSVSSVLFNALTLNAAYSWSPQNRGLYNQCRASYSFSSPVRPAFVQESLYELNTSGGGSAPWRQLSWLGVLNCIGGYTFGNENIWPFVDGTWQNQVNSLGSKSASVLNVFARSIPWWTLVPSGLGGMRTLVTNNAGSTDDNTVSAAATADGSLLVAYVGPAHSGSFDIDMGALRGPARARWFDPWSAAYTQIATGLANSGTRTFTTPGNDSDGYSDWVLVIDAQ